MYILKPCDICLMVCIRLVFIESRVQIIILKFIQEYSDTFSLPVVMAEETITATIRPVNDMQHACERPPFPDLSSLRSSVPHFCFFPGTFLLASQPIAPTGGMKTDQRETSEKTCNVVQFPRRFGCGANKANRQK